MEQFAESIARAAVIGGGATIVLDLWSQLLKWRKIPTLNFAMLGRWVGHIPRGIWFHDALAKAAPIRGERALGRTVHYATGVAFAAMLIFVRGLEWTRAPSLLPALTFGAATVVAPLFIMQPAMGLGIASSKTAAPLKNSAKSLLNHTVFGFGLYLAALATSGIVQ